MPKHLKNIYTYRVHQKQRNKLLTPCSPRQAVNKKTLDIKFEGTYQSYKKYLKSFHLSSTVQTLQLIIKIKIMLSEPHLLFLQKMMHTLCFCKYMLQKWLKIELIHSVFRKKDFLSMIFCVFVTIYNFYMAKKTQLLQNWSKIEPSDFFNKLI